MAFLLAGSAAPDSFIDGGAATAAQDLVLGGVAVKTFPD